MSRNNVCQRATSPSGVHRPLGAGVGGVKNSKNGDSLIRAVDSYHSVSLSASKCSLICRAQTCAHSGVKPLRSAEAILQSGPKSSKKNRIFHHFQIYVHISHKLLKIEAYKQRMEKSFISPLSNCRMCLHPSVT